MPEESLWHGLAGSVGLVVDMIYVRKKYTGSTNAGCVPARNVVAV